MLEYRGEITSDQTLNWSQFTHQGNLLPPITGKSGPSWVHELKMHHRMKPLSLSLSLPSCQLPCQADALTCCVPSSQLTSFLPPAVPTKQNFSLSVVLAQVPGWSFHWTSFGWEPIPEPIPEVNILTGQAWGHGPAPGSKIGLVSSTRVHRLVSSPKEVEILLAR